jgi:CheY-like chemotaxis protein
MSDMKILIVDDEEMLRELLNRLLRKSGHFVLESADAEGAFEVFVKNFDIDLVITDFRMHGDSGIDLINKIRNNRDARIWLVSNVLQDHIKQLALSSGAEQALEKNDLFLKLVDQGIVTTAD